MTPAIEALPKEVVPAYRPNAILRWLSGRFFRHIDVDVHWVDAVKASAERGTVVYVMRSLSVLDFLCLDYLTKNHRAAADPLRQRARARGSWCRSGTARPTPTRVEEACIRAHARGAGQRSPVPATAARPRQHLAQGRAHRDRPGAHADRGAAQEQPPHPAGPADVHLGQAGRQAAAPRLGLLARAGRLARPRAHDLPLPVQLPQRRTAHRASTSI